jgi:Tol biopolymer transport system component
LLDYGQNPTNDLYRADANTNQWTILHQPGEGGAHFISPDGRRVVIVTPGQINLMDVNGSHYRTLLEYPHVMIPSETHYYAQPVWSGDSQVLMVAISPQDVYYETTLPLTVWQLATDGAPPAIVAQLPAGFSESISPDTSKIAYTRRILRQANWEYELHISNIDGTEDTIYGDATTNFHVWTPDSDHFVFWSGNPTRYYLGKIGIDPIPLTAPTSTIGFLALVDETHFLDFGREENEAFGLRLGTFGEPSLLLPPWEKADDCLDYDFVK